MIHFSHCPICNSKNIQQKISAQDFTVSRQRFAIWECIFCTGMFTQEVPDQNEIGPYYQSDTYISHSDTKEGVVNQLYHQIRNFTLGIKKRLVQKETGKTSGHLLDVGCGTGAFLNTMKQSGWKITGLEPDEQASKKAEELYGITTQWPDKLFQLEKNKYDAITLWHVLEHVHTLQDYVSTLRDLLSSSGVLFIAVPNYTSYDAQHYKENWAAYDVPRHLYHFSPQSMEALMNKHGMSIKKIKPMWFDSFYVSMLSEKYKNNQGNIIKAFFIGFISNFISLFNHKKCSSVIYVVKKNK